MITIRNLSKRYGSLQVLDGLDLDIRTGETLVILGRSGMGKSVLLKHIIGITKPDSGTIDVDGSIVTELSGPALYNAIHNMGMLFQGAALFDSMTVGENTGFFLREHTHLSEDEIQHKVSEALNMVGLAGTEEQNALRPLRRHAQKGGPCAPHRLSPLHPPLRRTDDRPRPDHRYADQ